MKVENPFGAFSFQQFFYLLILCKQTRKMINFELQCMTHEVDQDQQFEFVISSQSDCFRG